MPEVGQTTEGQAFGGISGGTIFNLLGLGAKGEPVGTFVDPRFEIPTADLALAKDQQRVQAQIDAATAAGVQPSALLFTQLETIESQRDLLNRQFLLAQQQSPDVFSSAGVAPGTPLSFFINLFNLARPLLGILTGGRGQPAVVPGRAPRPVTVATGPPRVGTDPGAFGFPARRPAPTAGPATQPASRGFNVNRFIQCLIGSLSPAQTGGRQVPFVTIPGFASSTGSFDFGGFGGIVQSGIQLASSLLAPKPQQFPVQQAGFGLLAPAQRAFQGLRGLGGPLVAGGAGGAIGQGFTDLLFGSGGASTLDESAAFTDPVPGACRPKMHVKTNPCTGKGTWFVPRGRPLVFSGDLSAAKRLDRVAKTLDKARPRRRHHHHPR